MSFFKKLFGGASKSSGSVKPVEEAEYSGFHIATTPMDEGGQFRVCAVITKDVGAEIKTHKLIRADMCSTADEASSIAMRKARQMIDERGDGVF